MSGVYERGKYAAKVNGEGTPEYELWRNMIQRCDAPSLLQVTYVCCSVDERFIKFQEFMLWAEKQVGFGQEGFQLDKDLIVKGNKVYSPDVCVFVPREVNMQLTLRGNHRGDCPIGVNWQSKCQRYQVRLNRNGVRDYLGVYKTKEAAFAVYKSAKEKHMKDLANKWQEQIDTRVFEALHKWRVDIDD